MKETNKNQCEEIKKYTDFIAHNTLHKRTFQERKNENPRKKFRITQNLTSAFQRTQQLILSQ